MDPILRDLYRIALSGLSIEDWVYQAEAHKPYWSEKVIAYGGPNNKWIRLEKGCESAWFIGQYLNKDTK